MSRPILASRQPRDDLTILGRERNGPFVGDENHLRDRRSRRLGPQGQHPGTSRKPRALQGIRYGNLRMRARHGGRGTFTRSAGPGGSEFRGIGHPRERGRVADGEHASDHDQRRVVAEAGCRRIGVLGPVGARERKPVSRKLLGGSDAELGSWRSGRRPCRAENPHGTARGSIQSSRTCPLGVIMSRGAFMGGSGKRGTAATTMPCEGYRRESAMR